MVRWCVIACVLASLGGCSALFARGPGSRKMQCTDSHALPIVDTMFAVAAAVGIGAVVHRENDCQGDHCGQGGVLIVPLLPVVIVTVPSALWGYSTVGTCRAYKRKHPDEIRAHEALELEIRRLVADGNCAELAPLWNELLAMEAALDFERNIEDMVIARCAEVIAR